MALLEIKTSEPKRLDDQSNHRHRRLIGYIGLALPWLLILIVLWRDGSTVFLALDSVSAYYYTGANALFAGMLFVLAIFLFSYEGYDNKLQKWDQRFAKGAAVTALLVAFFPTKAPQVEGIAALAWWGPLVGIVHFAAAVALFLIFAVFCLWLFRATEESAADPSKKDKTEIEPPDQGKKWRNRFYALCGLVIVACIGWAGYSAVNDGPIFWQEAIALTAFALSWLMKGEWLRSVGLVAPTHVDDGDIAKPRPL
jgi:hypothetical protein